jgi:hypothetical protein
LGALDVQITLLEEYFMYQPEGSEIKYHTEQAEVANRELVKTYGLIGDFWTVFVRVQLEYFQIVTELQHLREPNTGAIDLLMALVIIFTIGLDYVFFHAPVDFFLKALITSGLLKMVLTIAVLIGYIFLEIKACYLIYDAWEFSKNHPFDRGAKFKAWVFSIGGFAYGCIPAGLFYFVMMAAVVGLPYLFVLLLCLMSIITHLWLIFGGKSTIRSLNRFFGNLRCNSADKKRHKAFKPVRKNVEHAHFAQQNFKSHERAYLSHGGKIDYFPEIAESEMASSIHTFIERGCYQVDPDELPFEFSHLFGITQLGNGGGGNKRKFLR